MADWPATLPQAQFLGLTDGPVDGCLRTGMDMGPPKLRRRFTAVPRNIDVPILLTGAQRKTFDTFFETTLALGALSFNWEDPVDDSTVAFHFRQPTVWTLAVGNSDTDKRVWNGTLALEILP